METSGLAGSSLPCSPGSGMVSGRGVLSGERSVAAAIEAAVEATPMVMLSPHTYAPTAGAAQEDGPFCAPMAAPAYDDGSSLGTAPAASSQPYRWTVGHSAAPHRTCVPNGGRSAAVSPALTVRDPAQRSLGPALCKSTVVPSAEDLVEEAEQLIYHHKQSAADLQRAKDFLQNIGRLSNRGHSCSEITREASRTVTDDDLISQSFSIDKSRVINLDSILKLDDGKGKENRQSVANVPCCALPKGAGLLTVREDEEFDIDVDEVHRQLLRSHPEEDVRRLLRRISLGRYVTPDGKVVELKILSCRLLVTTVDGEVVPIAEFLSSLRSPAMLSTNLAYAAPADSAYAAADDTDAAAAPTPTEYSLKGGDASAEGSSTGAGATSAGDVAEMSGDAHPVSGSTADASARPPRPQGVGGAPCSGRRAGCVTPKLRSRMPINSTPRRGTPSNGLLGGSRSRSTTNSRPESPLHTGRPSNRPRGSGNASVTSSPRVPVR